jgi:integrase
MYSKPRKIKDVYGLYDSVIHKRNESGNIGTALNYQCSRNSLKRYKSKLQFSDITVDFLNNYEKWLLDHGKSISTVGIYLRPLRAIINIAIDERFFSREEYPFGKRRYQIPASRNIKKALTQQEVGKIYNFSTPSNTWAEWAKDMWMFSYFSNGINMKDIALLKHSNIDGEFIRFIRAKSQNTSKANLKTISIFFTDELRAIVDKWSNHKSYNYLFPILEEGQTLLKQKSLITQFTKMVNKYIKEIAKSVGIEKPVTTYTARHSFATVLKRNGVSTEAISECLGHSSSKTTMAYLDSFEEESKKEISKLLNKF